MCKERVRERGRKRKREREREREKVAKRGGILEVYKKSGRVIVKGMKAKFMIRILRQSTSNDYKLT